MRDVLEGATDANSSSRRGESKSGEKSTCRRTTSKTLFKYRIEIFFRRIKRINKASKHEIVVPKPRKINNKYFSIPNRSRQGVKENGTRAIKPLPLNNFQRSENLIPLRIIFARESGVGGWRGGGFTGGEGG